MNREHEEKPPLSRLEQVDLRTYWGHEALEFTPWLAEEENLELLAETLGLPSLELVESEVQVGPFRADLLCQVVGSDGLVLIENQLEPTDHRHLGQILTYAAGLEATHLVWIAPRFSEEHRAALDWLNRVTRDELYCFGVQVELWKIGDSPLAPRFHLVSKPNEWEKEVKRSVDPRGPSPVAGALRDFWAGLVEYLEAHGKPFELQMREPSARNWASPRRVPPGLRLQLSYSVNEGRGRVWILFRSRRGAWDAEAQEWYRFAHEHAGEVEAALEGETVTWFDDESYARLERDAPVGEPEPIYEWLARCVPRIVEVFGKLHQEFVEGSQAGSVSAVGQ